MGVRWINSKVHTDNRGYFFEGYRETIHRAISGDYAVQVNISVSKPMVLRGFHWHVKQTDMWTIASGMAQVVVNQDQEFDGRVLAAGQGVIIPPGTGHGFLALSDLVLIYAVTHEYDREDPDENGYSAFHYGDWMAEPGQTVRSDRDLAYDSSGSGDPLGVIRYGS